MTTIGRSFGTFMLRYERSFLLQTVAGAAGLCSSSSSSSKLHVSASESAVGASQRLSIAVVDSLGVGILLASRLAFCRQFRSFFFYDDDA